jgi:hypothetical protein
VLAERIPLMPIRLFHFLAVDHDPAAPRARWWRC